MAPDNRIPVPTYSDAEQIRRDVTSRSTNLLSCPACWKEVSPQASACPHCGHPVKAPRSVLRIAAGIVAGIFAVIGILLIIFGVLGIANRGSNSYRAETDRMSAQVGGRWVNPIDEQGAAEIAKIEDDADQENAIRTIIWGTVFVAPCFVLAVVQRRRAPAGQAR